MACAPTLAAQMKLTARLWSRLSGAFLLRSVSSSLRSFPTVFSFRCHAPSQNGPLRSDVSFLLSDAFFLLQFAAFLPPIAAFEHRSFQSHGHRHHRRHRWSSLCHVRLHLYQAGYETEMQEPRHHQSDCEDHQRIQCYHHRQGVQMPPACAHGAGCCPAKVDDASRCRQRPGSQRPARLKLLRRPVELSQPPCA